MLVNPSNHATTQYFDIAIKVVAAKIGVVAAVMVVAVAVAVVLVDG